MFKQRCSYITCLTHREKPLALYIFSQDKGTVSVIINNTSSGNVIVNDVLLHTTGIFTYSCVVKSSYKFCLNFGLFFYDTNTACINCNFSGDCTILHNNKFWTRTTHDSTSMWIMTINYIYQGIYVESIMLWIHVSRHFYPALYNLSVLFLFHYLIIASFFIYIVHTSQNFIYIVYIYHKYVLNVKK